MEIWSHTLKTSCRIRWMLNLASRRRQRGVNLQSMADGFSLHGLFGNKNGQTVNGKIAPFSLAVCRNACPHLFYG